MLVWMLWAGRSEKAESVVSASKVKQTQLIMPTP